MTLKGTGCSDLFHVKIQEVETKKTLSVILKNTDVIEVAPGVFAVRLDFKIFDI